jgi:hypothetical protein
MPDYVPPLGDYRFVLHEALKVEEETAIAGYADLTPDLTGAVLAEAGKIASEVLAPLNQVGDRQGCVLESGVVRTPEGFAEAYRLLCEGGWPAMECEPQHGGQGMPAILNLAAGSLMSAANMAFMMYSGLTHGAYSALRAHGTAEQRATYLPKLASGEWTGTMNLTEPHCGTDLGLLRTRRVVSHHRHQDLHLGRRARPGRQHRPSGAGPHQGRAGGDQGGLALRGAEIPGQGGWRPRRAQRRRLHPGRGEDGHPRQRHLLHGV